MICHDDWEPLEALCDHCQDSSSKSQASVGEGTFFLAHSVLFTLGFGILEFVYLMKGQRCFQGMLEKSASISAFWRPSAMNFKEVIKLLYPLLRKSVFQLRGLTNAAPTSDKLSRWLWTEDAGWTVHADCLRALLICINADLPSGILKLLPANVINQERSSQEFKGKDEVDTTSRHTLSLIPLREQTLLWDMLYYLSNLLTYITGHRLPKRSFLTKYHFLYPRMLYKLQVSDLSHIIIFCEFQHTNMLINYGFSSINFFVSIQVFSLDKESGRVEGSCLPVTYTPNRILGKTFRVTVT